MSPVEIDVNNILYHSKLQFQDENCVILSKVQENIKRVFQRLMLVNVRIIILKRLKDKERNYLRNVIYFIEEELSHYPNLLNNMKRYESVKTVLCD